MYKPLEIITTVIEYERRTSYLYYKNGKIILPVDSQCENSEDSVRDDIYDTYIRTLEALDVRVNGIKIYLYTDNCYYAYFSITSSSSRFDINIGIKDGLYLAQTYHVPLYIKEEILLRNGYSITKEMIRTALSEN